MAEHDDAVSPIGADEAPSRAPTRAGNPLARGWAWFNAQPTQTKVIIIGVIVVLGVVAWMALRNKNNAQTDTEDVSPGRFNPLGASRFGPGNMAASPTALPPPTSASTDQPGATSPAVSPAISPGGGSSRPSITATATVTPSPLVGPTITPSAVRPPNIYSVTPAGMTPTMRGTDVSLSGTITPLPNTPTYTPSLGAAPHVGESTATRTTVVAIPKTAPTRQVQRPTVISPTPTQRGTNINF